MKIALKLLNDPKSITNEEAHLLAKALTNVFKAGGALLKERGRGAIARGGFGGKWQSAWVVKTYPKGGASLHPSIWAHHKIGYAAEFQDPETISGRPLIWLPIQQNTGGGHWTPSKWPGKLRGGRHGGKPILFGQVAVTRAGKIVKHPRKGSSHRLAWVPLFVGVRTVRDPKRFDLVGVAEGVADEIGSALAKVLS